MTVSLGRTLALYSELNEEKKLRRSFFGLKETDFPDFTNKPKYLHSDTTCIGSSLRNTEFLGLKDTISMVFYHDITDL